MIARYWHGVARVDAAEAYLEHLRAETFPALARLRGFVDSSILRRRVAQGVEFLVVTRWESLAAIRGFAGADVDVAVVPDVVQQMMVDFDRVVQHYEVVA